MRLHSNEVADQADDTSCGMFCLVFMDNILRGLPIRSRIAQESVDVLRGDYAFQIFLNNINPTVA